MSQYTPGSSHADQSGDVARHETDSLISSDKVSGTSVYDPSGEKLGSVHSVMIGKTEGRVAYAVLSFGGFLGMGTRYFPLPWDQLRYSEQHDGYVVSLTEEQLRGAPNYDSNDETSWERERADWPGTVDAYYGPLGRPRVDPAARM